MDLFETEWDIAFRTGQETERERIIKLIKAYEKDFPLPESFDNIIGIDEVIALIKGEQPHPPQQFRDRSNGE
jgi:hypothetical protein